MGIKDWLFGKPMSPQELAEFQRQHEEDMASLERGRVKQQADHVLNMQKMSYQSAKNSINQQFGFIVESLQRAEKRAEEDSKKERPVKSGRFKERYEELEEMAQDVFGNSHYRGIEQHFSDMSNERLLQFTEQEHKSPELIEAIEEYREQALSEFFEEAKKLHSQLCLDFIGDDTEYSETTYWERVSLMKDKREEEKVRKKIARDEKREQRETSQREQKESETQSKVAEGESEIDEAFERKKQEIENGDLAWDSDKVKAPYKGLDASNVLEAYAQEKTNELEQFIRDTLTPRYKAQIDEVYKENLEKVQNAIGFVQITFPYISNVHTLIRGEVHAYQDEKEKELREIRDNADGGKKGFF